MFDWLVVNKKKHVSYVCKRNDTRQDMRKEERERGHAVNVFFVRVHTLQ